MEPLLMLVPGVFFLAWLAAIIYMIMLATRLVTAVEQIARVVTRRPPDSPSL